ncbi:MAG: DUF3578 domain-containing protein [Spiroplasma poulsonii]|uniref:Type IV methyl-directed restriction enzyme EcoKMcrB subunit DNA-binding domain-containing protein n=1 Tax=Spiroplasma poulsonii TaxID=2138 RepID=A0A2P6FEU4_9MOLU|nr:DUF3578 domain-containing protein [Spiroplasma poulsonii]KAF0850330.1 hypothetical protein MSROBK_018850 [Spiroplasma poulsonii]MBW1242258.1 DUF3578 domain-containing protein [Spiroplasma poulsonii]PQM31977.1 hypothetical protein SMSRO_SF018470 [Spiroplasma poulsonii]PWF94448.1 hypothetical protein SMH99_24320 [Spiroplasma poulsonii]PWF94604.1 hypothetical protein SMSE_00170 [Spiroplasma poulsonii]
MKEIKDNILIDFDLDLSEYSAKYSQGSGRLAKTPWIGIKKDKASAKWFSDSNCFAIALIFTPELNGIFICICGRAENMINSKKLVKKKSIIFKTLIEYNQKFKEKLEKEFNFKYNNMLPPNPEKLLIPSNPNKSSRGNSYLYSSFVYKWLSFDEINEDILFNELNLLFEIYDKITENINMSSYYNMLEKIDLIDNISDNLLDGIIKKVDKVKSYNFNERKLIPIKGKTEKTNKKNIISRV